MRFNFVHLPVVLDYRDDIDRKNYLSILAELVKRDGWEGLHDAIVSMAREWQGRI